MIGKLFDSLSQAKRFTQLYLTNAYHQIRIMRATNKKQPLGPNTAILSIKLCLLDFLIL